MIYKIFLRKIKKEGICPFCERQKNFIILENRFAYLTPSRAPYKKNHLLVTSKHHAMKLEDLKKKEKVAVFDLVVKGMKILERKYPAIDILYREGEFKVSGKSIPHLHFHLIPKLKKSQGLYAVGAERKFLSEKELTNVVKRMKKW